MLVITPNGLSIFADIISLPRDGFDSCPRGVVPLTFRALPGQNTNHWCPQIMVQVAQGGFLR